MLPTSAVLRRFSATLFDVRLLLPLRPREVQGLFRVSRERSDAGASERRAQFNSTHAVPVDADAALSALLQQRVPRQQLRLATQNQRVSGSLEKLDA